MDGEQGAQIIGGHSMAEFDKNKPVTTEELLVSTLAQGYALAKLLIEKGVITQQEFMAKLSLERWAYQNLLKRIEKGTDA
jgi:hypothetical protein